MNNCINDNHGDSLVKLSGKITGYRQNRLEASFVLTRDDKRRTSIVSAALATSGMGGQAIGIAANASHIEEEADHVAFEIHGKPMEEWLWRSPFQEGDEVEVVVANQGDHHEIVAVAKPSERLVALYPHCVRSRLAFYKVAIKWWLALTFLVAPVFLNALIWMIIGTRELFGQGFGIAWIGVGGMFGFVILMLMRQWAPFVRTAQRIFNVLGWENASSIDLVKTTRRQRKPGDPPELGVYYFKY
ncbi:putative type VI secretion system effector [Herbaspirillum seropedicae]|uniref:putative type VI secretion system effector n=1 Tax=Herbaspirillum seropedicae TaxID=964 RepID=UPI0031D0C971